MSNISDAFDFGLYGMGGKHPDVSKAISEDKADLGVLEAALAEEAIKKAAREEERRRSRAPVDLIPPRSINPDAVKAGVFSKFGGGTP